MNDTKDTLNGGRVYDPEADRVFPDEKLNRALPVPPDDEEVMTLLEAQDVNMVTHKDYNDHGPKYIEVVLSHALRLYNLLKTGGYEFNGAAEQGLDEADESVIIALAAQLHDIGHIVHRDNRVYYSIPLAPDVLDRLPPKFYDLVGAVRIKTEVLHAILCHHREKDPLMLETGIIRAADTLDMERGRSRIPYEKGGHGINTLSGRAIKGVALKPGEGSTVLVEIEMLNTTGICQANSLLRAELNGSGFENYARIVVVDTKSDNRLVERTEL